jgi:hypothetical protein
VTQTLHEVMGRSLVTLSLGYEDCPWTNMMQALFGDPAMDGIAQEGLLNEFLLLFLKKQRDYGDHADDLGAPGQYAELHRKMGKLKKALWDGQPLVGEPAREVLMDLIGHCFLAIRHLDQNNYGGKPTK